MSGNNQSYVLIRSISEEATEATGYKKSARALKVKQGLLPPPVSLGGRAMAYLGHELAEVAKARVAGKSDDEIREIIAKLIAARGGERVELAA